jgi:hypothetical protein
VKVDEDGWFSKSQEPLVVIEEETTLVAPSVDPHVSMSSR